MMIVSHIGVMMKEALCEEVVEIRRVNDRIIAFVSVF